MRSVALCSLLLLAITSVARGVRVERDDAGRTIRIPDHLHRIVCLPALPIPCTRSGRPHRAIVKSVSQARTVP